MSRRSIVKRGKLARFRRNELLRALRRIIDECFPVREDVE